MLVQFFDLRDAVRAYEEIRNARWKVEYLNPEGVSFEIAGIDLTMGARLRTSNITGLLKAKVLFNPQNESLTASFVICLVKSKLSAHGDIKAIHSLQCCLAHVKEYCVEFYDVRAADGACLTLNNRDIGVRFIRLILILIKFG